MNNLLKGLGTLLLAGLAIKGVSVAGGFNIVQSNFDELDEATQFLIVNYIMESWVSQHREKMLKQQEPMAIKVNKASPAYIDLSEFTAEQTAWVPPGVDLKRVPITGGDLSKMSGLSTRRIGYLLNRRFTDPAAASDDLETEEIETAIIARNRTVKSQGTSKQQKLRAQYNALYGAPLPTAQGATATSGNLGNFLGSTTAAPLPKSQGATATSGNLGNFLGSTTAAPLPKSQGATATSGNLSNFLGSTTAASLPKSQGATATSGNLGFSTIPSFEEFSKDPAKYRKK